MISTLIRNYAEEHGWEETEEKQDFPLWHFKTRSLEAWVTPCWENDEVPLPEWRIVIFRHGKETFKEVFPNESQVQALAVADSICRYYPRWWDELLSPQERTDVKRSLEKYREKCLKRTS